MRRFILDKLRTHLQEHYSINLQESLASEDRFSLHQLDALLAFKSDPYLDELHAAFERLEEGTFGHCLGCKQQIATELIGADPTRRMCERCEQVYSRVVRVHEGSLLPV